MRADPETEVVGTDGRRHRGRHRTTEEQDEQRKDIAALRAKDPKITVRQIADALGLSVSAVARELEALEAEDANDPTTSDDEVRDAVVVPRRTGTTCLGVDPEEDDLRPCLEALLTGLERIRDMARGTACAGVADEAHQIVDTLIWRLMEQETPA